MKEVFFERSVFLPESQKVLFAWHGNPENLKLVTPRWIRVDEIRCAKVAEIGGEFHLRLRIFGFSLVWRGRWEEVRTHGLLVDSALESPFASWRHLHSFEACDGGTKMTDAVRVGISGPWSMVPFSGAALHLVLLGMFLGRHAAMKKFFGEKKTLRPRL